MTWIFDELSHAGLEHLTPEQVAVYDAKARVDPAPEVALLQTLGLNAASTLLDMGAGTGEFALAAAQVCRQVIAVDVSPVMLAVLQQKIKDRQVQNIQCVLGGFLSYAPAHPPVDVVYSRNALHHLPDFWKVQALRRLHGLLKPSGLLRLRDLVYSFPPDETEARITDWLDRAPTDVRDGFPRVELEAHLRDEYSTFSWLLEAMLGQTGFVVEQAQYSASGIFAEYVCRRTG
jgi:ubiquinone/menaquinone biosynthesis C-methylase UbiE